MAEIFANSELTYIVLETTQKKRLNHELMKNGNIKSETIIGEVSVIVKFINDFFITKLSNSKKW